MEKNQRPPDASLSVRSDMENGNFDEAFTHAPIRPSFHSQPKTPLTLSVRGMLGQRSSQRTERDRPPSTLSHSRHELKSVGPRDEPCGSCQSLAEKALWLACQLWGGAHKDSCPELHVSPCRSLLCCCCPAVAFQSKAKLETAAGQAKKNCYDSARHCLRKEGIVVSFAACDPFSTALPTKFRHTVMLKWTLARIFSFPGRNS
ncbi:hypothetical protein ACLOJK_014152 [Asimina triloba]